MRKNIVILSIFWMMCVSLSFAYNYKETKRVEYSLALQTARSFFAQILVTRAWNALQGGVYVPVSRQTLPNPYLHVPDRDVVVKGSLQQLTMINPAYMTRQISELMDRTTGIRFHITSLQPIRPGNKATDLEEESLNLFEGGQKEVGKIIGQGETSTFFYMAPLKTEKLCLRCHAEQGYKEGQIRGGISVTLPFVPQISKVGLAFGHLTIGLLGVLGIIFFGTRLGRAYEELRRQSVMDALTEIPNRRSFMERIEVECKRCQRDDVPLTVIMGDVDFFKKYNDIYGHKAGDVCLRRVAQAMKKSIKRPGDFCARYGGEEFVVILAGTSLHGGLIVAERIRKNIFDMALPHEKSSWKYVSLSLGVAQSRKNTLLSCDELVIRADNALYVAKERGRNRVEAFEESDVQP